MTHYQQSRGDVLWVSRALTTRTNSPGLRGSLSRLQLDYVDIVFANRNDVNSPMEGDELLNISGIAATVAAAC